MSAPPMNQQEARVADLIAHIVETYWYSACYDNEGGDGLLVDTGAPTGKGEFDLILFKKRGHRHEFKVKVELMEIGWDES